MPWLYVFSTSALGRAAGRLEAIPFGSCLGCLERLGSSCVHPISLEGGQLPLERTWNDGTTVETAGRHSIGLVVLTRSVGGSLSGI